MTAADKALVAAVFLQVALTILLLLRLGSLRVPMVQRGEVPAARIALDRDAWPERVKQVANAVDNQFQLPVLFYVGVLLNLTLAPAGWVEVALGWLFVLLRLLHAGIHITSNDVPLRFVVYTAGLVVLVAYWVLLLGLLVWSA